MKTKTVVIYDKWFDALGGGEVVAVNLACLFLKYGYRVKMIIGKKVPLDLIQKKLDIDLSKCEFLQNWNDELELQKESKDADLFINISFMDYSVGKAKKNIYYCHFPTKIGWNIQSFLLEDILLPVSNIFKKNVEILDPVLPKRIHKHLAYSVSPTISLGIPYQKIGKPIKIFFKIFHEEITKISLENLKITITNAQLLNKKITIDHHFNIAKYELELEPTNNTVFLKIAGTKNTYLINPKLSSGIETRLIAYILNRWEEKARIGRFSNPKNRLRQYDLIMCHSKFVQNWIKEYWHLQSSVCYPPVNLLKYEKDKKMNMILSVGRFFTSGHGKKQDIMIDAFKELVKKNKKSKWELHLAGGLGQETSSQIYYKKLKKMSKGYPIYFHVNKSRDYVEKLFHVSKIYWHAGGYKEEKEPIRMEHFGIAPVEGISAGCIPVLYNGGGLPEIIEAIGLDTKKHTFSSIKQLVEITHFWMKNHKKYNLEQRKLNIFSKDSFFENIKKIIQI